jgi:hypothetical protein
MKSVPLIALLLVSSAVGSAQTLPQLQANYVAQKCGCMFVWNMTSFSCSFYGDQWSNPDLDPNTFAPTGLNVDQWLDMVVNAGCSYATLVAKHHDGFALWPTAYAHPLATDPAKRVPYGISATTWWANNGHPDVVGQFVSKCRDRGLNPVLYMSIWDRTFEVRAGVTAATATASYISMIESQLSELLSNYGPITAIWTDGWGWSQAPTTPGAFPGGVGLYTYIPYATINNYIKSIQPTCLLVENNHRHPLSNSEIEVYETTGGDGWPTAGNTRTTEVNNPIRPDVEWFYCPAGYPQDAANTWAQRQLSNDLSFLQANVASYNIGVTVTSAGIVPPEQVSAIVEMRKEFAHPVNLALGKTVTSSSVHSGFTVGVITDGVLSNDRATYAQTFVSADGDLNPWVEIDLGASLSVGRVEILNIQNSSTGGQMRDLTVSVYDSGHSLVYTSPAINPANSPYSGSYLLGPGQLNADNINATGRYVRVTRNGTGSSQNQCRLTLDEVQVFGAYSSQNRNGAAMRGKAVIR